MVGKFYQQQAISHVESGENQAQSVVTGVVNGLRPSMTTLVTGQCRGLRPLMTAIFRVSLSTCFMHTSR